MHWRRAIAELGRHCHGSGTAGGSLQRILPSLTTAKIPLKLLYQQRSQLPESLRLFKDFIAERLPKTLREFRKKGSPDNSIP